MNLEERVTEALKAVIDPELGINMIDLGLLYSVDKVENEIVVTMTLTTPGCPLGGYFLERVAEETARCEAVDERNVRVKIVFDPPWTQDMMSEEGKAELGFD